MPWLLFLALTCVRAQTGEKQRTLALVNGVFHTGTGVVLRHGTMLVSGTRIKEIGADLRVPGDAEVMDLKGAHVTPGVVALFNIGRVGAGFGRGSVRKALDPFDQKIKQGLAAGITSYAGGSPGRNFSGANYVLKLTYGDLDSMLVCENTVIGVNTSELLGRNKEKLRKRISAFLEWRRKYQEYLGRSMRKEKGAGAPKVPKDAVGLVRAFRNEAVLWINSVRTLRQVKAALDFLSKVNIPAVFNGTTEGWILADKIGKARCMAIVWPRMIDDPRDDLMRKSGSSIEAPAVLSGSGVRIACLPAPRGFGAGGLGLGGILGRDMNTPFVPPAFAVRGGLKEEEAVSTVTLNPARMVGLDYRIGSLEEGKDADFIILSGDPLHYRTMVEKTFINGKCYYDRSKEPIYEKHGD